MTDRRLKHKERAFDSGFKEKHDPARYLTQAFTATEEEARLIELGCAKAGMTKRAFLREAAVDRALRLTSTPLTRSAR